MRGKKGKLICVWSPLLHQQGTTIISGGIGVGMEHFTDAKTLIINKSGTRSYLERYMEKDIDVRYSMDDLKVFDKNLTVEQVQAFSTKVADKLYLIAAASVPENADKLDEDFDGFLIGKCLEGFDMVIVDMHSGLALENAKLLQRADLVVCVMSINSIMLKDLFSLPQNASAAEFLWEEKTISVINKIFDGLDTDKELSKLKQDYHIHSLFPIYYDGSVMDAACIRNRLFSYMKSELSRGSERFPQQMAKLCSVISDRFDIPYGTQAGERKIWYRILLNPLSQQY